MTEPIRINPAVLRDVATKHEDVARIVEEARARGADIATAVESYGPIMHQVKSAVGDLLLDRDTALADHGARHRAAGDELHRAAHRYLSMDDENSESLRIQPDL
jgi:hypothetical protein